MKNTATRELFIRHFARMSCMAFALILPVIGHCQSPSLIISEIADATQPGGLPKFVELTNTGDTPIDMSKIKIANANNGGGSFTGFVPMTGTLMPGDSYVASLENGDSAGSGVFFTVFGFDPDNFDYAASINGDDVVGVFHDPNDDGGTLLDVYGVLGQDGSQQPWEYLDSHAFRNADVTSPSATFNVSEWTVAGANSLDGATAMEIASALTPGTHTFNAGGAPFMFPNLSATPSGEINFNRIGGLDGPGGLTGAEISAFDPATDNLFVTSGDGLQVVDVSDPTSPVFDTLLNPRDFGAASAEVTSVAVSANGVVAAAVPAPYSASSGQIMFFDPTNIGATAPVIFQESFESEPGAAYTLATPFDAGFDYFDRYGSPDLSNAARDDFREGFDGGFAIHSQDNDGGGGSAVGTITIPGIDISGQSGLVVAIGLGALNSEPSFQNYENADNDGVRVYATIDAGGRTLIGAFLPPAGGAGDLYRDTDNDNVGDGVNLTTTITDQFFDLTGTGSSLTLEIELTTTGSFEPIVVDNVRVQAGIAPSPFLGSVEVGALPDMVTFTPDGNTALVANEGEPVGGSMMSGLNGMTVAPLHTIGNTLTGTAGALNTTTAGDYTPVGILDGMGAISLDANTVRVFVNHELTSAAGASFTLANGSTLTGGRVSYFDIDKTSRTIVDAGLAFDTVINASGAEVTDVNKAGIGDGGGISRLCSANLVEAGTFNFVDTIFFTGEEDSNANGGLGGLEYALDVVNGVLYAAPAMGYAAWESVCALDPGDATKVALLVGDDRAGAPLYLYIGNKGLNAAGGADTTSFLARNGLANGTLYYWKADNGDTSPQQFNGTGASRTGTWVVLADKSSIANQDSEVATNNGFTFSRPEDVATDPSDPTRAVMGSTGHSSFPADVWGQTLLIDVAFAGGAPTTATLSILYDGDDAGNGAFSDSSLGLRSPDNLDWADDGFIYVQEDRSVGGFGGASGEEASIWRLNPADGALTRIAQIDRSVVLPLGSSDGDPLDVGDWESSGILDVSSLFGEAGGSLFVFGVQAHSVRDGEIAAQGLVEGGQFCFLAASGITVDTSQTTVDPEGSISLIDISGGVGSAAVQTASFNAFDGMEAALRGEGVKLFPDLTVSQDVEPEYIAISPNGMTAFVTLQENNAVAKVDIAGAMVTDIFPLGTKDHTQPNAAMDSSDRDGGFNLSNRPFLGLFQPDAIASYSVGMNTYFVTANEGDARDSEERNIKDVTLDATAFPDAANLQMDEVAGRLDITDKFGNTDADPEFEELHVFGARSFSIWNSDGELVFDSGDVFARALNDLGLYPDGRSDNKGAEPEGVTIGTVDGQTYAFVGLERAHVVAVFNITNPTSVTLVQLLHHSEDLEPEGLAFITAADSPNGAPLLAVSSEDSNTISTWQLGAAGPPIFAAAGPEFTLNSDSLNGALVAQLGADGQGDDVNFAITGGSAVGSSMMNGLNGYAATPLFTVGETQGGTTGALNSATAGDYVPVGILDGLGAYELDANTVRVFANHELTTSAGSAYPLANGATLTGARISYFDIDKGTRKILDAGLAYDTVINESGAEVTDANKGTLGDGGGISRLCSANLVEGGTFNFVDTIFFSGEEDSNANSGNGGLEYALDVANGILYAAPAMGYAAWESVTALDPGDSSKVALLVGDDRAGAPLYLYVGNKGLNAAGGADTTGFLARNGLANGQLYYWKADNGDTSPQQFNGTGSTRSGTWVAISTTASIAGQDAEAQGNGGFQFSRPEDVATDPSNPTRAVLASTGHSSFPLDVWGQTLIIDVTFAGGVPTTADIEILFDGDDAGNQDFGIRSPDNLDWADDGFIYIQEDRSIGDFGDASGQEASIWRLNPATGSADRIAQIDRSVVLPLGSTDNDPTDVGDWESSGILDVSTLFGETPGTLFLFDVQAHSIRDGLISDQSLVQGGQLSFLQSGAPANAFDIDPATGKITVNNNALTAPGGSFQLTVQAINGQGSAFETITVNVPQDNPGVRFATFNASLNRGSAGQLIDNLSTPSDAQARQIAEIIQRNNPDVLLINEFDYDNLGANGGSLAAELFQRNYLGVSQNGAPAVTYQYVFVAPSNTGVDSGMDFDNNGTVGGGNDAYGFGNFEGQYGMLFLSKYPIDWMGVRTFQHFLWKDMPSAKLPADPNDADSNTDTANWFTSAELDVVRLSSKSHWDIPVMINGAVVHALVSHPTPPVFDGAEDRNGTRNHDEIRFWADYVTPGAGGYIYDDTEWALAGNTTPTQRLGGLVPGASFVIMGDQNADPFDGDSTDNAAALLVNLSNANTSVTPSSLGGPEQSTLQGGSNDSHTGNPAFDTGDFSEPPGNLRIDYVLPSIDLDILGASVFWPLANDPLFPLVSASDHRMVNVDLMPNGTKLQILHASDLEGGVDAIEDAPAFATVVDAFNNEAILGGYPSITLSAGDNYIPGPFFNAAGDFALRAPLQTAYQNLFDESGLNNVREGVGRLDISIMNIIGFDASAVGNHEFDAGSDAFGDIIGTDIRGGTPGDARWLGAQFPYLSANLDFSGDGSLSGLFTGDLLPNSAFVSTPDDLSAAGASPKLAPYTVINIAGDWVGVVGATTPLLEQISSPGDTRVKNSGVGSNNMLALANILQPAIDAVLAGPDGVVATQDDINKVILVSHLQQFALEQELIGLLQGVDVVVAGGSDTLLADSQDTLRAGDMAGGNYPFVTQNADGDPAVIVSTDGQYNYVGRLVVDFDGFGVLIPGSIDESVSGAHATDEAGVLAVTGESDLAAAIANSEIGSAVQGLVSAVCGVVTAKDGNVVGRVGVFLEGRRSKVRTEETNMGDLTADANLAEAQAFDATVRVSIKNGGGIRAAIGSIDGLTGELGVTSANAMAGKGAGEVSQLDIENSLRFNNGLTLMSVTAQELKWLLEHGVAATDAAGAATPGQFPHVGGLSFSFDPNRTAIAFSSVDGLPTTMGERVRNAGFIDELGNVTDVLVRDGVLVGDPDREIRIVTLDFLAGIFSAPGDPIGGDGYPFPAFGENVVQMRDALTGMAGAVTFSDPGREQDALAEFLTANHATIPYYTGEAAPWQDRRIQNLAQNNGRDTILNDLPTQEITFTDLGSLALPGAEISAFDPGSQRLFVTHGGGLQVIDMGDPAMPSAVTILSPMANGANSDDVTSVAVGVHDSAGLVAVAVPNATATDNGTVQFYTAVDGMFQGSVTVGALPDAVTFSPDGRFVLSANEGQSAGEENEPDLLPNPVGSVSIIEVNTANPGSSTVTTLDFSSLDNHWAALAAKGVRLNPNAPSVGADLEPEYITTVGYTAYITLQENNAVAVIRNISNPLPFRPTDILPLGLKDHTLPFNKLDPSNRDSGIEIKNAPVFGMFMPDTIASYYHGDRSYFVTANEGDGRDVDETRGAGVTLDPERFPFATDIQDDAVLGRIKTSNVDGDTDGDGDTDQIHVFGGRSFSIFDAAGNLVHDSGDLFARVTADVIPALFNANDGDPGEVDDRSDDKGAEPEGLTVAEIRGQTYAFVGLERASGGLMVFNITNPRDVKFVDYLRVEGDISPEGVLAIPAAGSPNGKDLLVVTHEESNNIRVFEIAVPNVAPQVVSVGAYPVAINAAAGTRVGRVRAEDLDPVTYSIVGGTGAGISMAAGVNGFTVDPIFTVGQTFSGTTGALNPSTAGDYTPVGVLDCLGAYELDSDTVRLFANHELLAFRGNNHTVSDGAGGTFSMPGARISYFDIDKTSRSIVDAGSAVYRIYDSAGNAVSDAGFQGNNLPGFSRFCSANLMEPHQFGAGRGLENRIFFAPEEDGGNFNTVGGLFWALDVRNGDIWAVPAFGRGAWENIAEIDTGTTTHTAFLLADDSSPFDADDPDGFGSLMGDGSNEAAPMYLYVGVKNSTGDFLEQNGLRGGKLYVWKADNGDLSPTQFRGTGMRAGTWVQVDNSPAPAFLASETGDNGFDEYGYPTQRNLWLQAETLGAFQFSRPEDVATNPADGTEVVLASTGVDTFEIDITSGNGVDTFGTIYTFQNDLTTDINNPTATMTIIYDGDADMTRAIRSPDNLDWADDGFIYIQEDEAEEDTASGDEVLFGAGAANSNEAGIVRLNPADSSTLRVANIDRSVVIDPSIATPFAAVDGDAGAAGEWESSGILDVSTLFGEAPGTLFVFNVQAHGIEDQETVNAASRINDGDLVEGGQLSFLRLGTPDAAFAIDSNTGVITVGSGGVAMMPSRSEFPVTVQVSDGDLHSFETIIIRTAPGTISFDDYLREIARKQGMPNTAFLEDADGDGVSNAIDYLYFKNDSLPNARENWPTARRMPNADLVVTYTRVKNDSITWSYSKSLYSGRTWVPTTMADVMVALVEPSNGGISETVTLKIFFSDKGVFMLRVEADIPSAE